MNLRRRHVRPSRLEALVRHILTSENERDAAADFRDWDSVALFEDDLAKARTELREMLAIPYYTRQEQTLDAVTLRNTLFRTNAQDSTGSPTR